jgi:formyl-CoA transferase
MDEVFADPQVRHLGMAAPIRHPSLGDTEIVNQPIKLSRTPNSMQRPTPDAGEHTAEVLREMGYDEAAIADLRARKVV